MEKFEALRDAEKAYFTDMVKRCRDSGAELVICQWGFDDEANHLLMHEVGGGPGQREARRAGARWGHVGSLHARVGVSKLGVVGREWRPGYVDVGWAWHSTTRQTTCSCTRWGRGRGKRRGEERGWDTRVITREHCISK